MENFQEVEGAQPEGIYAKDAKAGMRLERQESFDPTNLLFHI